MFTGLVQHRGSLAGREMAGESGRLVVDAAGWQAAVNPGESVSVDGVCLTLVELDGERLAFDVLAETFRCTSLAGKALGAPVNLEQAVTLGTKLGGHIVNGHVDGVGEVTGIGEAGRDRVLSIRCPETLADGIVFKGCVACNGVSLTVASLRDDTFVVHLIPETLKRTSLEALQIGDPINLEIDVVGKYVRHYVEAGNMPEPIEWDRLRQLGLIGE